MRESFKAGFLPRPGILAERRALPKRKKERKGRSAGAVAVTALAAGTDPLKLVTEYMSPAMAEVGKRFECNTFFVPELLLSARAMKSCLELIRPLLTAQKSEPVGRVAIGTVKGDLHDIGKNLVSMMLEGAGFEVMDLGVDVTPDAFVKAAQDGAQLIGMSALLTTTMPSMKQTVQAAKEAGLRTKVIIGGAPVTQQFCDEIGADGYSPDAASAVDLVLKLMAA